MRLKNNLIDIGEIMIDTYKIVKIYDEDNKLIGKGHLLSLNADIIKIKGTKLPILSLESKVIIEIYYEFSGIATYYCRTILASYNQLNAHIVKRDPVIERRNSLKIRTDLSYYVRSLCRNNADITSSYPRIKINMLNLSFGGMLISSNIELYINDVITFDFIFDDEPMLLKAKVIRIDKIYDNITKDLISYNYGCVFEDLPSYYEDLITKYLFKRQLSLYRDKKEQE